MFTYFDIMLLALILLCVFVGYCRGFVGSIIKLFNGTVKFFIAYFVCKPFSQLLSKFTSWDDRLTGKFHNWAAGLSDKFNSNLVGLNDEQLTGQIDAALTDTKFPKILRGVFKNALNINAENINGYENITIADLVGKALSAVCMIVISFLMVYILITVLLWIVKIVNKRRLVGKTLLIRKDRRWGAVVGFVKSLVIISIALIIMSLFKNSELLSGLYETLDKSFVSGPVSRFVFKFVEKYFNLNQIIIDWLA